MKQQIFELTYFSKAIRGLNALDVEDILVQARAFNHQHNLTGCLIYHKREFVQILEGDKRAVKNLFEKIEHDRRHYDVNLLAEGYKYERDFEEWDMVYFNPAEVALQEYKSSYFEANLMVLAETFPQSTHSHRKFWTKVRRTVQQVEQY